MDLSNSLTPSDVNRLEGANSSKKYMFCPFSPMDTDDRDQQESDVLTPKRRLSLNMDESSQSPLLQDTEDGGYGESISSCMSVGSSDGLLLESSNRSPLVELNINTPSGIVPKRRTLHAKRLRSRPTSLITEKSPLSENALNSAPLMSTAIKLPSLTAHTTLPLSLPSLSQPELSESWPIPSFQGTGSSLTRHISSPLEKMTLMSPTGPTVFTFNSQSSTNSHRTHSLTSTMESDGYFSEIEVFENDEPTDTASDTIKTLFNAPLSEDAPITFFASKEKKDFPCFAPIRPLLPQRSNTISQCNSPAIGTSALQNARRCSLKRSGLFGEQSQFHLPKRPPLPFLHCSNSQDSPIATAVEPSPLSNNQLKGRCLLRSQSYCMPLLIDGTTAPSSPGELIGDESMPYALPLVRGNSPELKCISPETLSSLIAGGFNNVVDTYSIIDCRYPYEFEGGHIQGAVNIWEKDDLLSKFFTTPEHPKLGQRIIYIFHCEFSSKRGPEMCQFLREHDRKKNGWEFFPKLYYPELYLLEGGYKAFYQAFSEFCEPRSYCLMLDEKHKDDLRHFKQRTKSWAGELVLQSRRHVPSRCRRRATGSRPKSNSIDSMSSPTSSGTDTDKMN